MSLADQAIEDKFLDKNLEKGYIVPLDSPYGFSTFMVPKKDSDEKCYIINYCPLNAVTKKDVTPLPNLAQCIERLQCYDLPLKFSLPSSLSATSPPFAVPQSNPEPSPTIIFFSALLNLSPPQPAQPPDQSPDMSSHQSYLLPKYHLSPPKPLPYQEAHLPFPDVEPCPPTPPIPWS